MAKVPKKKKREVFTQSEGPRAGKKYSVIMRGKKKYRSYQGGPTILVKKGRGFNSGGGSTTPEPEPFDPLAPSYPTVDALTEAAEARGRSQIQPILDQIAAERNRAQGATDRRTAELGNWYGDAVTKTQGLADRTNAAMTALTSQSRAGADRSQELLAAALAQTQQGANQFADMLNAQPAQSSDPNVLSATAANNQANQQALASAAAAAMGEAAGHPGIFALGGVRAREGEALRHQGVLDELTTTERGAMGRLGDLITSARDELIAQEAEKAARRRELQEARANRIFQQRLAGKEFGLKKRSQEFQENLAEEELGETKRRNREEERQGRVRLGIDKEAARAQQKAIQADIDSAAEGEEKERAKLRGQRRNNGITALSSYLAPTKEEQKRLNHSDPKVRKRGEQSYRNRLDFDQALRMLRAQSGMGTLESLYLIRDTVDRRDPHFRRWYERAVRMINDHLHPGWRSRRAHSRTESDIRAGRVARPQGTLTDRPVIPRGR